MDVLRGGGGGGDLGMSIHLLGRASFVAGWFPYKGVVRGGEGRKRCNPCASLTGMKEIFPVKNLDPSLSFLEYDGVLWI